MGQTLGLYKNIDKHLSFDKEDFIDLTTAFHGRETIVSKAKKATIGQLFAQGLKSDKNFRRQVDEEGIKFSKETMDLTLSLENVLLNEDIINHAPDLDLLRRGAIAVDIIDKASHELQFLPWIRTQEVQQEVVRYLRWTTAMSEENEDPAPIGPSGSLPSIRRSLPVEREVAVDKWGFQVEFSEDALFNTATNFDYINANLEYAAYSYSKYLNTRSGVILTNDFSTSQTGDDAIRVEAADAVWSADDADPIKDLLDLKRKLEGGSGDAYYVKATDAFLHPENFREIVDYLRTVTQQWSQSPFQDITQFVLYGLRIHQTPQDSGIPDGTVIMLPDPNANPPMTMYHRTNPKYSRVGPLHTKEYEVDKNNDIVFQFWDYLGIVLPVPPRVGMLHSA